MLESKIELLHNVKNYPDSELKFLIEACQVVIKCRNFLKFTYAYGYYCISNKTKSDVLKKNLFEDG